MKKHIKIIIVLAMVIASAMLTGCLDANIDGVITQDNLVSLTYTLEFDDLDRDTENYKNLNRYLDDTKEYWDELGFDAKVVKKDKGFTVTCAMEQQCETREEALKTLYSFMTNEISVFDDVEYSYAKDYYKEDYSYTAAMDISKMLDKSVESMYPEHMLNTIDEFFENSKLTVNLELPYNDSDVSGVVSQKTYTQEISFENETEIVVTGVIKNFENAEYERQVLAAKADYENKIKWASIISGVLLLGLIGLIVGKIVRGKNKKSNLGEGEETEPKELTEEQKIKAEKNAEKAKIKAEKKAAKVAEKAAKKAAKEAEKAAKDAVKEVDEAVDKVKDAVEEAVEDITKE